MKPKTIDEYIGTFPQSQQVKLKELRQLIKTALPDTKEDLKWNSPAFLDEDGMILVMFSGHKQHMNFVATPSTKEALEGELSNYETGKGSVKLFYDKPLPAAVIKKMALYRAKEYRQDGVKWM